MGLLLVLSRPHGGARFHLDRMREAGAGRVLTATAAIYPAAKKLDIYPCMKYVYVEKSSIGRSRDAVFAGRPSVITRFERRFIMRILPRGAPSRLIIPLIVGFAAFCLSAVAASAESYSDTDGHWGASVIEKWSEYDVLHGDGDGTFAPNRDMSVAELATVLVNAFGYPETGTPPTIAPSVPSWAKDNVRKAVAAGVIRSDETGLTLTRELAAKIIANAFGVAPVSGPTKFADDDSVSAAYKPYVAALGALAVFNGGERGDFMPKKGFTRAEIMQTLDNAVSDIVSGDKSADTGKSVIINKDGVTLTAVTVKGDLIIGQGVGEGDVTLTDVKIEGSLVVLGGGEKSIHI
jgi:hypothetical protein